MMKLHLLTVLCIVTFMMPARAVDTPKGKLDLLTDLPGVSWLSDYYKNNPYRVYASAGVAAFALLYTFNEGFRAKVKGLFGIESKKGCGCGCRSECGCRTEARSACTMKPSKNNEVCACCSPRPASTK